MGRLIVSQLGGSQRDSCTLILYHLLSTYSFGTKTWVWSILMQKSKFWKGFLLVEVPWTEVVLIKEFLAFRYIRLVKKHGLEISQPGLEPNRGLTWQMTKRLGNSEVHKYALVRNPHFGMQSIDYDAVGCSQNLANSAGLQRRGQGGVKILISHLVLRMYCYPSPV